MFRCASRSITPIFNLIRPGRRGLGLAAGTLAVLATAGCSSAEDGPDQPVTTTAARQPSVPAPIPHAPTGSTKVTRYVVMQDPGAIASVARSLDPSSPAGLARVKTLASRLRAVHDTLRPRLRALGAEPLADVVLVANVIQVRVPARELKALAALPGVARLEEPTLLVPTLDVSVPLIGAPALWERTTPLTGEGIRIGIIDTGIDYFHAAFGGAGDPTDYEQDDHTTIEGTTFPTLKVAGGVDLAGDDYDARGLVGSPTPTPDEDPVDCAGHGTHVAGIAAGMGVLADHTPFEGPWNASLDPSEFVVSPGVAPEATLYAIKLFGCDGASDLLLPALEWAVDPDGDGDPSDRLDVVNASLGGDFDSTGTAERDAVAALTSAGALFVAAAGNGAGGDRAHFSTGAPATAPSALSVGMTLKESEQLTFLALEVSSPASVAGSYPVGESPAGGLIADIGTVSGEAVRVVPELGCEPLTNAADVDAKIALVKRGTCPFLTKAENAAAAGATGLLIIDNSFDDFPMNSFSSTGTCDIPMWSLRRADGEKLWAAAPITVTMTDGVTHDVVVGPDYPSFYTGRGPSAEHLLVKPDLSAPGGGIWSAKAGSGFDGAASGGTSMAAPTAAGAAALLRQALPALGPLDIKERMVSTTRPVTNGLGTPFPSTIVGSGRLQVDRALDAAVTARVDGQDGETGISFGVVRTVSVSTETRTVIVTNAGADAVTLDLTLIPATSWPGATVGIEPATITVPAGGSTTFALTLAVNPAELPAPPAYEPFTDPISSAGSYESPSVFVTEASGVVTMTVQGDGEESARVAYHGVVQAAAERQVGTITGCRPGVGTGTVELPIEGTAAPHGNATSVLELGTEISSFSDPTGPDAHLDLVAVGVLSDPNRQRVHFGVVTAADWTTPARGWRSEVGVEVDVDGDEQADFLVLAESFHQPEADKPDMSNIAAPFARVVNLATGEPGQGYLPLNAALPAYPGGSFYASDEPETHETHLYFNRVLVFPVDLAALGLDSSSASLSYRGVSRVSRLPLVLGRPMEVPLDTTDWVQFDAGAPALTLPSSHYGSPLCPEADGVELSISGEPPTLLVLHHANADDPHHETVDLASLEGSDLAVTAGAGGAAKVGEAVTASFEVTNSDDTARTGVVLSISADAGTVTSLSSSSGSCSAQTCSLGDVDPGATVTVDVTATPDAEGSFVVSATVSSATSCEADTSNDEASETFSVDAIASPDGGVQDDAGAGGGNQSTDEGGEDDGGCGCRQAPRHRAVSWAGLFALLGLAAMARRRR